MVSLRLPDPPPSCSVHQRPVAVCALLPSGRTRRLTFFALGIVLSVGIAAGHLAYQCRNTQTAQSLRLAKQDEIASRVGTASLDPSPHPRSGWQTTTAAPPPHQHRHATTPLSSKQPLSDTRAQRPTRRRCCNPRWIVFDCILTVFWAQQTNKKTLCCHPCANCGACRISSMQAGRG